MGFKGRFKIHLVLAILLTVTHRGYCADDDYGEPESDVVSTCIRLNTSTKRTTVAGEGEINLVDFLENGTSELFPVSEEVPEDVVLILGNTGSGKTTLTQMIAGDPSKLHATVMTVGGNIVIVDEDDKIGEPTTSSRTIIPELVITQNESFYDCPGFDDNRGAEYDLAVNYFMNQITERVRRVKLIFLINHNSVILGQDRNEFDRLVSHATKFVKNLSSFQTSVGLVVTKVDAPTNQKTLKLGPIKRSIVNFINIHKDTLQKSLAGIVDTNEQDLILRKMQFMEILLNKERNYNRIAISVSPDKCGRLNESEIVDGTRNRVLNMIRNLNFSEVGSSVANFGFTLQDKTIRKVKEVYINDTNQAVNMKISEQMEKFTAWYNTVYTKSMESLPIVGFGVLNIWDNVENLEVEDTIYPKNIAQDICLGFTAMGYNCSQEFADFMAEKQTYFEFFDRATDSQLNRETNKWLQTVNAVKDNVRGEREQFKLEILSKWVKEVNNLITRRVQVEANSIKEWIDSRVGDVDSFGVMNNQTWVMLSVGHKFKVDTDAFNSATELAEYIGNLTTGLGDMRVSEEFTDILSQADRTIEFFDEFLQRKVSRDFDAWVKPLLAVQHQLDTEKHEYLKKIRNDYAPNTNIRVEECFNRVKHEFTEWFNMEKAQEKNNYPRVSPRMRAIWNVSVPTSVALNASAIDIYESYRSTLAKIGYILSSKDHQCVKNEYELMNKFDYITQENLFRPVLRWFHPLGEIRSQVLKHKEYYLKLLDTEFVPNTNEQIAAALDKTFHQLDSWLRSVMVQNSHSIESLETFVNKVINIKASLKNIAKQNSTFIEDLTSAFRRFGFIPPGDFQQIQTYLGDLKFFEELKGYPVMRNIAMWKQSLNKAIIDELNKDIESQISSIMKSVMKGLDKSVTGMNNAATLETLQSTYNRIIGFQTSKNLNSFCRNIRQSFDGYLGTTVPSDFTSKCSRTEGLFQKLYHIHGNDLSRNDSQWQLPLLTSQKRIQTLKSWYEFCAQVTSALAQYDFQMKKPEISAFSPLTWANFLESQANVYVPRHLNTLGDMLRRDNSIHFDKLVDIVRNALHPTVELCENDSFVARGNYLFFSKILYNSKYGQNRCPNFKNLEIYAKNTLFLDESFRADKNKMSILFAAQVVEVIKYPVININGLDGEPHHPSRAKDGIYTGPNEYKEAGTAVGIQINIKEDTHENSMYFRRRAEKDPHNKQVNDPNSEYNKILQSMRSASNGRAGKPGGNGGALLLVCFRIINASRLQISSNGGQGGRGQDGGNGEDGNGCYPGLRHACDGDDDVGGDGGNGGIGGAGGRPGSIEIVGMNSHLARTEEQFGVKGPSGKGGHGGLGGKGTNATECYDPWGIVVVVFCQFGTDGKDGKNGKDGTSDLFQEEPEQPVERKRLNYAKQKYLGFFGTEATNKIFNEWV